jgi:hypothetical protein
MLLVSFAPIGRVFVALKQRSSKKTGLTPEPKLLVVTLHGLGIAREEPRANMDVFDRNAGRL